MHILCLDQPVPRPGTEANEPLRYCDRPGTEVVVAPVLKNRGPLQPYMCVL